MTASPSECLVLENRHTGERLTLRRITTDGQPCLAFYLAHLSLRHRQTQEILVLPRPVQAVLFRAVVLAGTLLGRYRGTDWPGCPTRCSGAPSTRR